MVALISGLGRNALVIQYMTVGREFLHAVNSGRFDKVFEVRVHPSFGALRAGDIRMRRRGKYSADDECEEILHCCSGFVGFLSEWFRENILGPRSLNCLGYRLP